MKKTEFLSIGLFFIFSLLITGCESDDNEDVCEQFVSPVCATLDFTVCSDGDKDYLEFEGEKYVCDTNVEAGKELCDKEADEIIAKSECKSVALKSGGVSYKSFVLNAVSKVRAEAILAAGCN